MRESYPLRYMALTTVMLWAACFSAKASDADSKVWADRRILTDLCRLRLTGLRAQTAEECVVVARIRVADAKVVYGSVEEALIAPVREFDITIEIVEVLAGVAPPHLWKFAKRVPDGIVHRHERLPDPYCLLGTLLAVIDVSMSKGNATIIDTFVIPANWESHVGSALTYVNAHRKLFSDDRDPSAGQKELRELLDQENPFLAIAAAQVFTRDAAGIGWVINAAGAAREFRQSALALLALQSTAARMEMMVDVYDRMRRIIDGASTTKDIRGFALAVRASSNGVAEVMINAVLLGAGGLREVNAMTGADRLQPLFIGELRRRTLALDPEVKDDYLGVLVGLRLGVEEFRQR